MPGQRYVTQRSAVLQTLVALLGYITAQMTIRYANSRVPDPVDRLGPGHRLDQETPPAARLLYSARAVSSF
jgi:hypothetical protein